jgi:hypothetical protein
VEPRPGTSPQMIAPNNPIITQRAAKAAKQSGEVGSNNGAKGKVRINAAGMEYFNERTQTWGMFRARILDIEPMTSKLTSSSPGSISQRFASTTDPRGGKPGAVW